MIPTGIQLENMSKDELIKEFLNLEIFKDDMDSRLFVDHLNDFTSKHEMVNSALSISKRCNELLLERIIPLERNNINNAQM